MTDSSVLIVNDTRVDRHYGCHAVIRAIIALLESNNMRVTHFWPAHVDWRANPEFELALSEVCLVVVNAEGTIHHNRPAGRRLLEVGARARASGVPVALINAGWEANGSDLLALLSDFDIVAARDSQSASQMRSGGANVRVVPDLSIWSALTLMPRPSEDELRAGVGFTDNVEQSKALELENLRKECRGASLSIFQEGSGLFPALRFVREGISLRQDLCHPSRLAALLRMRHQLWQNNSSSFEALLRRIAGFELVVSGRFHACTLALAMGTPVIGQRSNTNKIAALFDDAGLASRRGALPLSKEMVFKDGIRGWNSGERENLNRYLRHAYTSAETLFGDLAVMTDDR